MSISEIEAKAPFVTFEMRPMEDRAASAATGRFMRKDVCLAIITPAGSKDRIERVAVEWLAQTERSVEEGRMPGEWLDLYKRKHRAFLDGQEAPVSGTSLRDWPGLSPAQYANLVSMGVTNLETLAELNEEGVRRLGMGGVDLRRRAKAFLEASQDTGKVSLELANLRAQTEAQEKTIAGLTERLNALAPAPTRPPVTDEDVVLKA